MIRMAPRTAEAAVLYSAPVRIPVTMMEPLLNTHTVERVSSLFLFFVLDVLDAFRAFFMLALRMTSGSMRDTLIPLNCAVS